MKRVFVRFDTQGICIGRIITHDPSFAHDPTKEGYEEISSQKDQDLIENNECKRIIDRNGREKIVLL